MSELARHSVSFQTTTVASQLSRPVSRLMFFYSPTFFYHEERSPIGNRRPGRFTYKHNLNLGWLRHFIAAQMLSLFVPSLTLLLENDRIFIHLSDLHLSLQPAKYRRN